ncbi:putative amidohydrolase [Agrobacterium rubi TR3 = NBRC 13261]|uniref:Putative amidohydrolase n=1 Tax=Agrobacterium rubi TR3 = NBRC 13261 TaxID=1368415 RepID=A0A081CV06_9HYPH|nr:amidohydrolase family protein [Agrobacterium rubi]MBP1879358.1 D-galactarolactone isomerase [Agrobacterium rubi]MCL6653435.1 amidohydrolase [Agrobacterium rubi]GAK70502.1 putative amidohydrolase [Agrobacterium rubi TR3 = NBRC 13261]
MTIVRTFEGDKPRMVMPKGAIDTQMHMYLPDFPALEGGPQLPEGTPGPDEYRRLMKWIGIDRVVITQGNAHQRDNGNLMASLRAMGDVAKGVAVVTRDTPLDEIQELIDVGVVGARIMDLPGGAVDLTHLEEIDSIAQELGWCVAVQFDGSHILDHGERLAAIKSRWIFDHHGKFFAGVTPDSPQVAALKRLIDKGNCWFKFAGCYESSRSGGPDFEDIAAVARVIADYAPDRIIWGTNWPHNNAKTTEAYPDDADLLDTVLSWLPSDEARKKALVTNPEELFGFDPV